MLDVAVKKRDGSPSGRNGKILLGRKGSELFCDLKSGRIQSKKAIHPGVEYEVRVFAGGELWSRRVKADRDDKTLSIVLTEGEGVRLAAVAPPKWELAKMFVEDLERKFRGVNELYVADHGRPYRVRDGNRIYLGDLPKAFAFLWLLGRNGELLRYRQLGGRWIAVQGDVIGVHRVRFEEILKMAGESRPVNLRFEIQLPAVAAGPVWVSCDRTPITAGNSELSWKKAKVRALPARIVARFRVGRSYQERVVAEW